MDGTRGRVKHIIEATSTDWAYLAGFIDGEGCIASAWNSSKTRKRPRLTISQKYPAPLLHLAGIFGGNVRPARVRKGEPYHKWVWCLTGGRMEQVLRGAIPYMQLKPDQAEIAVCMLEMTSQDSIHFAHLLSCLKHADLTGLNSRLEFHDVRI